MDSGPSSVLFDVFFIFVLILLNAFFSAAEIAIVSVNKSKIKIMADKGNKKAQLLLDLMKEPNRFLATIQDVITLAGFLASALSATWLSVPLAKLLEKFNIPSSNEISIILGTLILSYFTLVLGELFPKKLALQSSEKVALFVVKPLLWTSKVTFPFDKILTLSVNLLGKITNTNITGKKDNISIEEIQLMIDAGEETGIINETEKEMINGVFKFDDTLAKNIMTPKVNVFVINVDTPIEEILSEVAKQQYSRIPVYEDSIDNIIGILYMKDLFISFHGGTLNNKSVRDLIRSAYFVPETKNIDELFEEMQITNNHMSILIDEYGNFTGIVTIDDLIEEVMGNIPDEHDKCDDDSDPISRINSSTYIVDGLVPIDDINEELNINLPYDIFDTIGGFVIDLLGHIPKHNEYKTLKYGNITFKIENVKEKRIDKLEILLDNKE
ncbi:MAG: hemolysin family protein [Clostridium tyrobutyricum]|jgi:putative hemolysin|uniref:hemolysin family protein n=2 Tax=Clostridium tyrobutyricum TaxID=1519 RepID=UPI002432EBA3|nr:hemolysin family protein [Clostridium tyrobutyricum]MCH4237993.1 hemolysin family protein [Clostridium tyrobutyricum]MCH4258628.1 hemolysin family protein [Clostridium tyrobutyricum]MCI1239378.1 hemolysin family protein [Clostridium tyrobutyricum]MCI1652758.1 hemolysin family protein [Clostridium tyrobutyricum]MCI1937110.1 hemolysin family protein [Clostridium tyrobutyricum]